jgi:SAM-dependent methyltransferase
MDERTALPDGYRRLLREQTDPSRQVGWSDRLQQLVAFEALAGVGPLCGRETVSVLDVGCGLGDFFGFLRGQGFAGRYTGVDLLPEFVAAARSRYADETAGDDATCKFLVGDILDPDLRLSPHDYVVASGLFDYLTPDSDSRLSRTLDRLFALCRRGVAWNLLNVAPPDRDDLYRPPAATLLPLCARSTPWFVVRGDYDPHALTFYLYKRDHFVTEGLQHLTGRLFLDADARARVLDDPLAWAAQHGVSLRQLNILLPLLEQDALERGIS